MSSEASKPTEEMATPPSPSSRPIPDEATWQMLEEAYKKAKGDSDRRDRILYESLASSNRNGFHIAFEARHIPGKGRGLIAANFVHKGAIVCDDRCGRFRTEREWRDFLALLPHEVAKDSVDWCGVDDYSQNGTKQAVYMDLTELCLVNHGFSKDSLQWWERVFPCWTWRKVTANIGSKYIDGMWRIVALRDIEAGEELLCDYNQIGIYKHSLPWYDVICQEYYPGVDRYNELERWCKKQKG